MPFRTTVPILLLVLSVGYVATNLCVKDNLADFGEKIRTTLVEWKNEILEILANRVQNFKGELEFASYYQDSMVLPRAPNRARIWGYGIYIPLGKTVKINAAGKKYTALIKKDDTWEVVLDAITSKGPYTITVSYSENQIKLRDVLFGDIWLCSGQSNMGYELGRIPNSTNELEDSKNFPDIRMLLIPKKRKVEPQNDFDELIPMWETARNTQKLSSFSAVCWLFGKEINKKENVPVGLIDSDWGGSPIESWMSADLLKKSNCRISNSAAPKGELWNAMIHPLLPLGIYGVIWYQGESNAWNPSPYSCLFPEMIKDWRKRFNERGGSALDFPFGFVQLAAWDDNLSKNNNWHTNFPHIRWAQTARIGYVPNDVMPKTFMAVAMDTPDFGHNGIHPRFKRPVAERLVYGALHVAYGRHNVKHQGPFPTKYLRRGNRKIQITFDEGDTPLKFGTTGLFEVCCSLDKLRMCSDNDNRWIKAKLKTTQPSGVIISHLCSKKVFGVRYAWQESPCGYKDCAVYSVENNLPAPPFVYHGKI
ncbi:unnamed protein product [Owenia fusiformis]|uniref:Sialate O-acetylesterase domain-containing protein n=1 Tax=Owenia fusiformis TaxID=6347 RepID=A0A8J1UR34_OWEFU|nr:unnamed protein product [Owenia fusiformis]